MNAVLTAASSLERLILYASFQQSRQSLCAWCSPRSGCGVLSQTCNIVLLLLSHYQGHTLRIWRFR